MLITMAQSPLCRQTNTPLLLRTVPCNRDEQADASGEILGDAKAHSWLSIETHDWATAPQLMPMPGSGPQVAAIVWWARALGKLRATTPVSADADIGELQTCREALRAANDAYWMAQTDALLKSAQAWRFAATGDGSSAVARMTAAADEEDALEKLPLTPGPIVPAREQLADLFLVVGKPREAVHAFNTALTLAPGRLGALRAKAEAERQIISP